MEINSLSFTGSDLTTKTAKRVFLHPNKKDQVEFSSNKKEKPSFKDSVKSFFKRFKTAIIAVSSSFITACGVWFIANGRNNELAEKNKVLENENNGLKDSNSALDDRISKLEVENKGLKSDKHFLDKKIVQLQKKLDTIELPNNMEDELVKKLIDLDSRKLLYSTIPELQNQDSSYLSRRKIALPEKHSKTNIRANLSEYKYPDFVEGKPYEYEFPMNNEIKITNSNSREIKPISRTLTTISSSYAESLAWDDSKIARDLLQNFYDGHGQTLNGVKFKVTPDENGKYNVRIEGKSIYSPEKAILLGETTKKKNSEAAGNYGEGLKMVVLKLLKEKGVDEVNIASDNWKTNWQMQNGTFGTDVLTFELDKVKPIDGNYIEFKTDDVNFIKTIIKTFDRFYHSGNPSFHSPDFENDTLGINFRNDDDKGKFYIAGQTFEVNGEYEGLGNMNFYIKKKPPVKYNNKIIFDPSRDRTSLNSENLEALGLWVVNSNNMSQEEAVKLLSSLREYWDAGVPFTKNGKYKDVPGASFISGMLNGLASRGDLYSRITFPDNKDIGYNYATPEMIQSYMDKGYRFCNDSLSYLGMKSFNQVLKEARCHSAIEPNQQEKNRILILQDAIKLFEPYLLKNNLFNEKELCPNVYIFDKNSPKENKTYETALAEAIVQDGQSKGFWIDKSYLSSSSFSSVLGTALHELTHKYGGDESMEFSYKLTDVMKNMIATINADPKLGYQLKLLEQAWEKQ